MTPAGRPTTRLGRTLYVVVPGSKVSLDGGHLVVKTPDGGRTEVPRDLVSRVVVSARVALTGPARQMLLRGGATVVHVSHRGRLLGVTMPFGGSGAALRRAQHLAAADGTPTLVRVLLADKIANQRALLRRYRHHRERDLGIALERLDRCVDRDEMLGVEGRAARVYFEAFADLVPDTGFPGRRTRPARDPVNAALNYAYTVLAGDATVAAVAAGFDPGVGLLHEIRSARPAMGLDLMEPFRAPIVDSLVVAAFRRRILRLEEFTTNSDGVVRLGRPMARALIRAYEQRVTSSFTIGGERHPWRGWLHRRAQEVAAALVRNASLAPCRWR